MKENNKLFDYTLIFISILSIGYFILVTLNSRFITAYLTYPIFAFICISYGYFELKIKISLLSKLPLKLNYFIKIIFNNKVHKNVIFFIYKLYKNIKKYLTNRLYKKVFQ